MGVWTWWGMRMNGSVIGPNHTRAIRSHSITPVHIVLSRAVVGTMPRIPAFVVPIGIGIFPPTAAVSARATATTSDSASLAEIDSILNLETVNTSESCSATVNKPQSLFCMFGKGKVANRLWGLTFWVVSSMVPELGGFCFFSDIGYRLIFYRR